MRAPLLLALVLVAPACSDPSPAEGVRLDLRRHRDAPRPDEVVATFADDTLTVADLEAAWRGLSEGQQDRLADAAGRQTLAQRMVDFELLAREAARQELHHAPDILAATKRLMVERLLEQEHARVAATVTEADLEAWYEAHLTDFRRPAEVQVSHLFLPHPPGPLPAPLRQRTEALADEAARLGIADHAGFARLVEAHSEDLHSRSIGGDLRFRSHAELSQSLGPAVADAAFALRVPGERSEWVQGTRGLHLLRLTARRPALALSLAQPETRERVRRAVLRDREQRAEAALLERLGREADVAMDEERLFGLALEEHSRAPISPNRRSNLPPGSSLPQRQKADESEPKSRQPTGGEVSPTAPGR